MILDLATARRLEERVRTGLPVTIWEKHTVRDQEMWFARLVVAVGARDLARPAPTTPGMRWNRNPGALTRLDDDGPRVYAVLGLKDPMTGQVYAVGHEAGILVGYELEHPTGGGRGRGDARP
jgi:hypothetical protein